MQNTTIKAVQTRLKAVPRLLAPTVNGSVITIQKNYAAFAGIQRSQKFFYREAKGIEGARTKMQQAFLIYMATTAGSPKRRSLFDAMFRSWSRFGASLADPNREQSQPSRLWDKADRVPAIWQAVNRSLGNFDMELAWVTLTHLQAEIEDLLADVEVMRDMGIEK